MSKPRVYFSKSKSGDAETIKLVLSHLRKYDIEIVQWDNSEGYKKDKHEALIASCSAVVMLPPKLPEPFNYHFHIGKGQHTERKLANEDLDIDVYYVINVCDEFMGVNDYVNTYDIVDNDWKIEYAFVECEDRYPLEELCIGIFNPLPQSKVITKQPRPTNKLMLAACSLYLKQ